MRGRSLRGRFYKGTFYTISGRPWGGVSWEISIWGCYNEGTFCICIFVYMRIYAYICVYMAICGPNHLVIPLPSLFLYHLLFKTMTRVVHHYLNVVWTALIWMSTVLCIHRTILYWVKSAKNLRWNFRIRINPHDCTSTSVFAILYSAKMGPWKVLNFQCGYLT